MNRTGLLAPTLAATMFVATSSMAAPPARTTILVGHSAIEVLRQCSRPTPPPGSAFFRPKAAQIEALDRAASTARRPGMPVDAHDLASIRRNYAVEIVGVVRSGRRFVYGNYYPLIMQDGIKHALPGATVVCDGGRRFFGVEIDASSGHLTHMAFNGR